MLNRRDADMDETKWDKFLFGAVYFFAAAVAAYHSAIVFLMSDPWYVAVPAALVVDGLTAYSVGMLGRWKNNQRAAGFVGVGLFVIISASAQIIARYEGVGVTVPAALRWISLALVPLSSTGAVIALGAIKYFGSRGKSEIMSDVVMIERPQRVEMPVLAAVMKDVEPDKTERQPHSILAPVAAMLKRGRGRPKKVAFAKDVEEGPKV